MCESILYQNQFVRHYDFTYEGYIFKHSIFQDVTGTFLFVSYKFFSTFSLGNDTLAMFKV
jgi:hypothetical protein